MASSYLGKPCPKCAHVRSESEVAPDWQCPKCGVAYAKFVPARPASEARVAVADADGSDSAVTGASTGKSNGLAIAAHVSILLGFVIPLINIIAPIVIWQMKRGEDELAVACSKEAINFQISVWLWWLLVGAFFLGGMAIPPLMILATLLGIAIFLASLVFPIIAAVKAAGGESYYYPRIWHIFE